jgi:DNA-binding CsgD family transcriptional regulator
VVVVVARDEWIVLLREYEDTERVAREKVKEWKSIDEHEARLWNGMKGSAAFSRQRIAAYVGEKAAASTDPLCIPIGDQDTLDWLAFRYASPGPEETVMEDAAHSTSQHILWSERLTTRQYACIMAYTNGWSESRIGRELGISKDSVKTHLKRARQKMNQMRSIQMSLFESEEPEFS